MPAFRQAGSALISALFIMTLIAIAATAMSLRLQLDIHRTALSIKSDKLYLASQLVSFWALSELSQKKLSFVGANNQGKVLDFPAQLQNSYPGATISGGLYDLQAKFNVNNVIHPIFIPSFTHLLRNIQGKNSQQNRIIALALHEWLSPYVPGKSSMYHIEYYLKQKPPYYPAQQLMASPSELRLLQGITPTLYQALQEHVIALPESTTININTASKTVLSSLGKGLTESEVEELIAARGEKSIQDLNKIKPLLDHLQIKPEYLTTVSQYYLSVAEISFDDMHWSKYSMLKRTIDYKGHVSVSIIQESLNAF